MMIPTLSPDLGTVKSVARAYADAVANASPATVADVLARHLSPECLWRGVHPFDVQHGPDDIAATFWAPFLSSFARVQRREDVFFAGLNEIEGFASTWTCSMGHFMGLFDAPFLNIPPTRRIAMLPYAEFCRIEDGRITEIALFVDLLHLMVQAGLDPLRAPQAGAHLVQPGPRTHDGVMTGRQPTAESQKTLDVINTMIEATESANAAANPAMPEDELAANWHDDMVRWGPTGIGATYTVGHYIAQHLRPFRKAIEDRTPNGHLCRMAQGRYGALFGWPTLTVTNSGGFMGVPGNDFRTEMRVADIYRREGDKLAESWTFIDMLHFMKMQGVDILAEIESGSTAAGA